MILTASIGEAPVLELWGLWSTALLRLLADALWSEEVVAVGVPSYGQIDLFRNYSYLIESCGNKNILKKIIRQYLGGFCYDLNRNDGLHGLFEIHLNKPIYI